MLHFRFDSHIQRIVLATGETTLQCSTEERYDNMGLAQQCYIFVLMHTFSVLSLQLKKLR